MNEQFESLAKAVFDHCCHERGAPRQAAANWDEQEKACKNRYRTAAMVACLIIQGPIYRMEMFQTTAPESW